MRTRKSLLIAVVCLVAICAAVLLSACADNGAAIVTNGDFENGTIDGWTLNDTSSGNVTGGRFSVQPSAAYLPADNLFDWAHYANLAAAFFQRLNAAAFPDPLTRAGAAYALGAAFLAVALAVCVARVSTQLRGLIQSFFNG